MNLKIYSASRHH